eukprot:3815962-Amphidinium_carterae.1
MNNLTMKRHCFQDEYLNSIYARSSTSERKDLMEGSFQLKKTLLYAWKGVNQQEAKHGADLSI